MSGIFIHQILTRHVKPEELDPGFLVLDNSANERPDWFEYWPIRNFLLNRPLDEESFYGFVSPRFKSKTNLSATAAREFVRGTSSSTDAVLLSPSLQLTAYHWNVFVYGDAVHPGLLRVASEFFKHIGQPTDLSELITDSRNEVYSNYVIAKPRFWRAWLEVTERLFAIAESATDPLGMELRMPTSYRGGYDVQMKVFILERIATWMLARSSDFNTCARDPFVARSRIYKLPGALACNALKIAYVEDGRREEYKIVFRLVSHFGRFLTWQVRLGAFLGSKRLRSCLAALGSNWAKAGRS